MDKLIKRISERLSAQSSRRGFFSNLGRAILGAAMIIGGQGFFAQRAEARTIKCCTGTPCPGNGCPTGTMTHYTWSCGVNFYCHDCSNSSGAYVCTYFST